MDKDKLLMSLHNAGFETEFFETKEEAAKYMASKIKGKTVGIGGSMTVMETGIAQALEKDNTVYWHWNQELVKKMGNAKAVRDLAVTTDVYISSVNAISENGEIVNIDGTGNRIASTAYGHDEVYFVLGTNKVTPDLESAIWRARNVAAPKNAQRLKQKTPCAVKADKCYDCNSKERICNGFLIMPRPMRGTKMTVVIINGEFGA